MTAREHALEAAATFRATVPAEEIPTDETRVQYAQTHALVAIALALTNHPGLAEEGA